MPLSDQQKSWSQMKRKLLIPGMQVWWLDGTVVRCGRVTGKAKGRFRVLEDGSTSLWEVTLGFPALNPVPPTDGEPGRRMVTLAAESPPVRWRDDADRVRASCDPCSRHRDAICVGEAVRRGVYPDPVRDAFRFAVQTYRPSHRVWWTSLVENSTSIDRVQGECPMFLRVDDNERRDAIAWAWRDRYGVFWACRKDGDEVMPPVVLSDCPLEAARRFVFGILDVHY